MNQHTEDRHQMNDSKTDELYIVMKSSIQIKNMLSIVLLPIYVIASAVEHSQNYFRCVRQDKLVSLVD